MLDLGCGAGRVAVDLAREGHDVVGLDRDPDLLEELRRRAAAAGGARVETVLADATDFDLGRSFALILAPQQLVQLVGAASRPGLLAAIATHLAPGGLAALAAVEPIEPGTYELAPVPDAVELDGWVHSSLPLELVSTDRGIAVRRLRQSVSPEGELTESVHTDSLAQLAPSLLDAQATEAGLLGNGQVEVPASEDHAGSIVRLYSLRDADGDPTGAPGQGSRVG